MAIETHARGGNGGTAATDEATLLAHDWTPSLQVRVGGWTWRVDPDDQLPVGCRSGWAAVGAQGVRAYVWSRLLIG